MSGNFSAGEIRSLGCVLPDTIPDCAWVPRKSLFIKVQYPEGNDDPNLLSVNLILVFTEPFQWFTVDAITTKEDVFIRKIKCK